MTETDPRVAIANEAIDRNFGTSQADLKAYAEAGGGAAAAAGCAAAGVPEAEPLCEWAGKQISGVLFDLGVEVIGAVGDLFGADPCKDHPDACVATNALIFPWQGYQDKIAKAWIAWSQALRSVGVQDPAGAIAALVPSSPFTRVWWTPDGLAGALEQWPSAAAVTAPLAHMQQYQQSFDDCTGQLTNAALLLLGAIATDSKRVPPRLKLPIDISGNADDPAKLATIDLSGRGSSRFSLGAFNRHAMLEVDGPRMLAMFQEGLAALTGRAVPITGQPSPETWSAWSAALDAGGGDRTDPAYRTTAASVVLSAAPSIQDALVLGFYSSQIIGRSPGTDRGVPGNLADVPNLVTSQKIAFTDPQTSVRLVNAQITGRSSGAGGLVVVGLGGLAFLGVALKLLGAFK